MKKTIKTVENTIKTYSTELLSHIDKCEKT